VDKDALVLEIGSGGSPYPRANILCDAYLETHERHFAPLMHDRPMVLAFAEDLPFKNNVFDFVIASHVLEHSSDPERFISEIQRVGRAGYIEVPDAFMERVCSYPMHRLEIGESDGGLMIRKKLGPISDPDLSVIASKKISTIFPNLVAKHPFQFHVRYYWSKESGGIKYSISNNEYKFDWNEPKQVKGAFVQRTRARFKGFVLSLMRKILSQNRRNDKVDFLTLLMCKKCKSEKLYRTDNSVICSACGQTYSIIEGNIINCVLSGKNNNG
jgi:SAM-dependent methyltransferase